MCHLPVCWQIDLPASQLNPTLTCRITFTCMKRITISMALVLTLLASYAQGTRKGTVEISAGPSFPFGEFAYSANTIKGSGYATNGIHLAISFKYRLKAQLGLVAMISEYNGS